MSWTSRFVTAVATTAPFLSSTGWWTSARYRSPTSGSTFVPAEAAQERAIGVVEGRRREEVGTARQRRRERLLAPPSRDRGVIAGEQHVGNARAAELGRPRVLRTLEDAGRERVVD